MHKYWKIVLAVSRLAALPVLPSMVTAAEATQPITTLLVGTSEQVYHPDPICSKCKIIVLEDEDATVSRADIWIAYPSNAPPFVGSVEVTVWLENDEPHTLWLTDVSLAPGDEVELVVDAGPDWSWDAVRLVWLRFMPE